MATESEYLITIKDLYLILIGLLTSIIAWLLITRFIKPIIKVAHSYDNLNNQYYVTIKLFGFVKAYDVNVHATLSIKGLFTNHPRSWQNVPLQLEQSFIPVIGSKSISGNKSKRKIEILLNQTQQFNSQYSIPAILQGYNAQNLTMQSFKNLPPVNEVCLQTYVICTDKLTGIRRVYTSNLIPKANLC